MANITKYTYKCSICGKEFSDKNNDAAYKLAMECEQGHDVVYIPMLKSDLKRLWSFIFSGERALLTDTLLETLRTYNKL